MRSPASVGDANARLIVLLEVSLVAPTPCRCATRMTLATVTMTGSLVLLLPAASRATAVSVWGPLTASVVFQVVLYGPASASVPNVAPSTNNWTPTTPTSSLADAVTLIVPTADPAVGEEIATVGGV